MVGCIYSFTVSQDASHINIWGVRQLKPLGCFPLLTTENFISTCLPLFSAWCAGSPLCSHRVTTQTCFCSHTSLTPEQEGSESSSWSESGKHHDPTSTHKASVLGMENVWPVLPAGWLLWDTPCFGTVGRLRRKELGESKPPVSCCV